MHHNELFFKYQENERNKERKKEMSILLLKNFDLSESGLPVLTKIKIRGSSSGSELNIIYKVQQGSYETHLVEWRAGT